MSLRDILADAGVDVGRIMDGCGVLYLQDIDQFDIVVEGTGYPGKINDIVEIDPGQPGYGSPNATNHWRYAGDTTEGLNFNPSRETRWIETDQHPRFLEKHVRWAPAITGNLSQFEVEAGTLDNWLDILGGGTLSSIAGATPTQKLATIPMGSGMNYRRSALIYPHEYNDIERTLAIVLMKTSLRATGDISFVGNDQASIPFGLEAQIDDRSGIPADQRLLFCIYAPGA